MKPDLNKIYDVIIVGAGPAGLTAALYCGRAGFDTLVLEKLSPGGQMATTNEIENYPGFPGITDGFTLAMNMKAQAEQFGVQQDYAEVKALRVEGEIKLLDTKDGTLRAKSVILAPGADRAARQGCFLLRDVRRRVLPRQDGGGCRRRRYGSSGRRVPLLPV